MSSAAPGACEVLGGVLRAREGGGLLVFAFAFTACCLGLAAEVAGGFDPAVCAWLLWGGVSDRGCGVSDSGDGVSDSGWCWCCGGVSAS